MPPSQFDLKEIITPILSLLLNPNQEPVFLLWFRVKNNKCIYKKYIFHYKQLMWSERRLTAQKVFFFFLSSLLTAAPTVKPEFIDLQNCVADRKDTRGGQIQC